MLEVARKQFLLVLIFIFSFFYRILLLLWNIFPSGADIGLHNSVIYSITGLQNTNFFYNAYQMGGGTSLTFPGYHIFASSLMILTAMPEYLVHATIVSVFSSLTVLCAFLITRRIWTESAAFIIAFLVAISRFDIEMLLWGGYPNVITLMLIPLTFYMVLQKDQYSLTSFLVSTSLLVGSIFLTHSLSAGIFVGVIAITLLFALLSPKTFGTTRKTGFYLLLPIAAGALIVSPFLVNAVPIYLMNNSSAPGVQGVNDISSAILSTRILPLELVLPLFAILAGFAVFSKKYNGKFFSFPIFLLSIWLVVPLFLTQGYLFGFIIDYNRFLYFIILPAIIFVAVLIDYGSGFFAKLINSYRVFAKQTQKAKTNTRKILWLAPHVTNKTIYGAFILFFLLFSFFAIPIFLTPMQAHTIQSFYQVMNNPGWEAIKWAKQNTPSNAVFVSDALYGWWFSGFAQRPTLSAVDPQYLTSARELAPAKNSSYLLDTDYLVDNGLVQVREDGGYIARHNPEILATLNWTYFPYSFFTFDSSQNIIKYTADGKPYSTPLNQLSVREMYIQKYPDHKTIIVSRGNEFFNYTQFTTVYRGVRFVNITSLIHSTVQGVSLDWLDIDVQSKGGHIKYDRRNTIGLIDDGVKVLGQLIFSKNQPNVTLKGQNPLFIHLEYNLQNNLEASFQIMASAYSVSDNLQYYKDEVAKTDYFDDILMKNADAPLALIRSSDFEEDFDYRVTLQEYSISYVACRVPEMYPKFLRDPAFSLVFINSEVAVFKVKG